LGPFDLAAPIGRGGMGQVWRGRHRDQGVPVAVKVLDHAMLQRSDFRELFRNEVRAAAGLEHEGIVLVLDQGEVPEAASRATNGRLQTGSPYLVMELLTGGTLHQASCTNWTELRALLLRILDALAHAHARGVIHRDLKPGNVLLSSSDDLMPGIKLTDFGTAHAVDQGLRAGLREDLMGTLQYMPPEQIEGRWRDYGPWTDLYALGCLGWRMATGRLPFAVRHTMSLIAAQLNRPPPDFEPAFPVPAGLGDWFGVLLAKDPRRRFERAADAAWALSQLGEPVGEAPAAPLTESDDDIVFSLVLDQDVVEEWKPNTLTMTLDPALLEEMSPDELEFERLEAAGAPLPRPALPRDWRRERSAAPSAPLVGAGLGLFGLRTVPLVGRDGQRDAAWAALRGVHDDGTGRVVLIEGDTGTGKTRLATWIAERAHEVGAAFVVRASHSSLDGPTDGLGALVARLLGVAGLSRDEARERMNMVLRTRGLDADALDAEVPGLVELALPRTREQILAGESGVAFTSDAERQHALMKLLRREGRRRPVLLVLDDVQWGPQSMALLRAVAGAHDMPVLALATVRTDLKVEAVVELGLEALYGRPHVLRLPLKPLGWAETEELVGELLGVSGELARRIARRAGGNPMFAVQLLGDWVKRGLLRPTPDGFVLDEGVRKALPSDLHELWWSRIEKALDACSAEDRLGLEIAAALGREIDRTEWYAVCDRAGVVDPDGPLDALAAAGLARAGVYRWSFQQHLVRDSLEQASRDAGRWAKWNRLCAEALAAAGASPVRQGGHRLEAGEPAAAAELLLDGANRMLEVGNYTDALGALERWERAVREASLDSGVTMAEGLGLRSMLLRMVGRYGEAEEQLDRLDGFPGLPKAVRSMSTRHRAVLRANQGRLDEAESFARRAVELGEASGDERVAAEAHAVLARRCGEVGKLDEAEALARSAIGVLKQDGDAAASRARATLMHVLLQAGRLDEAEAIIEALAVWQQASGRRCDLGMVQNNLGEVHRRRGDFAAAERAYGEAKLVLESAGDPRAGIPGLNLASLLLLRGDYREAGRALMALHRELGESGLRGLQLMAEGGLVTAAAGLGDWAEFDERIDSVGAGIARLGVAEEDLGELLRLAGEEAAGRGERERAKAALVLAKGQFDALHRPGEALRIEARLERL